MQTVNESERLYVDRYLQYVDIETGAYELKYYNGAKAKKEIHLHI